MRKLVFWIFVLVVAGAVGGSLTYAARPWYDAVNVLGQITDQQLPTPARPTYTPLPTRTISVGEAPRPTPTPTLPPVITPRGRTNYLLLASDNDSKPETGTSPNTQVMIFVSYDTTHRQIYAISIPRDLWVPIPGFIDDKIDTASGYDGLLWAVRTVQDNFSVHIDHYAWVGLNGFVKIINSLGGVDIAVTHPIVEYDFPNDLNPNSTDTYGFKHFYIPSGPQHLDGVTALEYVRARHADLIGDFGRSQRQQQVLLQLKSQLKDLDLGTVPNIVQDLQHEFATDLTIPQLLGLARSALGLPSQNIHRYFLNQQGGYTTDGKSPDGKQDILVPNWPKIQALFGCVMSDTAYRGCAP